MLTINFNPSSTLYILEIHLDKPIIKVGITDRKIEERVTEILTGIWKKYRYFPYCRPKRFKSVTDARRKEKEILEKFKEFKYVPKHKFSGYTELLDTNLDEVVQFYDSINN